MCDFNDAYIVVTGKITATNPDNAVYDRKLAFKNNAPFFNSILKINNQLIENAQNLDIVMPMYNLLYYSKNFRKTTGYFGIITGMNQILDIVATIKELEYFIQLKSQNAFTIKQNK